MTMHLPTTSATTTSTIDKFNSLKDNNLYLTCFTCKSNILEYFINIDQIIRICSNSLCNQSIEFVESKFKYGEINRQLIDNLTLNDILNENFGCLLNDFNKLNEALIKDDKNQTTSKVVVEVQQPLIPTFTQDINVNNKECITPVEVNLDVLDIFDDFLFAEPDTVSTIIIDQTQKPIVINDYHSFNTKTNDTTYYNPQNDNISSTMPNFIDTIAQANDLLSNYDDLTPLTPINEYYNMYNLPINHLNPQNNDSQIPFTPLTQTNSSIVITKLDEKKFTKQIELNSKLNDDYKLINNNETQAPTTPNKSFIDLDANRKILKRQAQNDTNENDEDLLPWEKSKKQKLNSSNNNNKSENNIFTSKQKTSSLITKQNQLQLSSKVKEQQNTSLKTKEKGAVLKNALIEESNQFKLLNTKQVLTQGGYKDLVLSVLKKKTCNA